MAAVVDVGHHDVIRLIEDEKDASLADAEAIPAFQRTLQRLDVAATGDSKHFQGVDDAWLTRGNPTEAALARVLARP